MSAASALCVCWLNTNCKRFPHTSTREGFSNSVELALMWKSLDRQAVQNFTHNRYATPQALLARAPRSISFFFLIFLVGWKFG
uniref:Uncharacterized protein n=2 Tax=unclassified Vibrio TaxID=2614977 RepID=D5JEH5_9VIBR|nr:hypothetical protein pV5-2-ORF3 [Vibrio sp. VP5(2010)]ADE60767.1 hypothetical protein repV5-2-ORF3 [Vibrio sp. VP5(2010)]ADE60769.1 hypothetical protein repV6-ORF2 [Vibrio sp. VP6(2010)]